MEKINEKESEYKLLKLLLPYISTFLAVILGAIISQYVSDNSYDEKHNQELKEQCYSELSGAGISFIQSVTSHNEAGVLSGFYYTRFQMFSKHSDYELAIKEDDRAKELIKEISKNFNDLYKTLAKVKIAFKNKDNLYSLVDSVITAQSITVYNNWTEMNNLQSVEQIEKIKDYYFDECQNLVDRQYRNRIDSILSITLKEIKEKN